MKYLINYDVFLEAIVSNTQTNVKNKSTQSTKNSVDQKDDVETILQSTEDQKQKIIAKKDAIEKGILNNINTLEPDNQKEVKTQVNDYRNQVREFDKTVKQIGQLNQTLKKSNIHNSKSSSNMDKARTQNNL